MTSTWKGLLFTWVLMLALLAGGQRALAEGDGDGDNVARVGTIPVTKYELKREMQRLLPFNSTYHGGVSPEKTKEIKEKALAALIERAYMVQYALKQELAVPNDAVEQRLEKFRKKFKTPEAQQEALGEESLVEFRASVYRILLAEKAEEAAVTSKEAVSDAEIRKFYEENQAMYQRPKQYRASHILVKVDPSLVGEAREKLRAKAEELAAKAKAGEDFYNLAYYNSDEATKFVGGDIGYFHSGQTVKEFENAIVDLKPGEIVGPVETISGFHVIKLVEVQEARLLSFEEVAEKLATSLKEKRHDELYQQWMDGLKQQYPVERLLP